MHKRVNQHGVKFESDRPGEVPEALQDWTEENDRAADEASEADRLWFEQHPGENERVRPAVPGELPKQAWSGAPPGWGLAVVVQQVHPGFRIRRPVWLPMTELGKTLH